MQSVEMTLSKDQDTLTITVDLKSSESRKSILIATTEGIVTIPGSNAQTGLNVFVK